jgi:hypothetical protein
MKKITLILTVLLCITLANASVVSFSPHPPDSSGIIYSDSTALTIKTTSPVICKYNKENNVPFESMGGNFDENLETVHKKVLTELSNGVHTYYIKCRPIDNPTNESAETEDIVTFKISNPISALITLASSPLKSGKYEITLQTTKIPTSTPQLKYSYDGISYTSIVLHGSEKLWKGFLVISQSTGEKVGSFKFDAKDIEGRPGSQIYGDNIFTIDTISPPLITSLSATGEYGQIILNWFLEEDGDVDTINVYRSESPGVDLTDFYKTISKDKDEYYDTQVESGKTYYYRISSEDEAGNTADLSKEIQATSLLSETTSATGISPLLIGSVDALLSEIDLLEKDIENSDNMISSLTDTEKNYIKVLKITDNFQNAKSELVILKRNVESYKLTDITKEILDGKLSSSRVKLNVLKKKIPDTFSTLDLGETSFSPTEETTREAILEYSPELTPNQIDKTVKESLSFIEENNLQIKSKINIFETIYLDGTKITQSIIEHSLDGTLEKIENSKFILRFPSGSIDLSSLAIKNLDYTPEQEGLISFKTDTKKITYTLEQKLDTQILKEITISLIVSQEESTLLTGYFLSEVPTQGSTLATFLMMIASGLIGYLFYIKQQQQKEVSLEFLKKAKQVKLLQEEGKTLEATELYNDLKVEYLGLSKNQKHEVFKEIKHLTKQ